MLQEPLLDLENSRVSKSSKQLTCTPIVDQDGNNIEGNKPEDMAWEGEPTVDSEETKKAKALIWRNIGIVIGIILGILGNMVNRYGIY